MTTSINDKAAAQAAIARDLIRQAERELRLLHRGEMLWSALADGRLTFAEFKDAQHNPLVELRLYSNNRRLVIVDNDDNDNVRDFFTGEEVWD